MDHKIPGKASLAGVPLHPSYSPNMGRAGPDITPVLPSAPWGPGSVVTSCLLGMWPGAPPLAHLYMLYLGPGPLLLSRNISGGGVAEGALQS